MKLLRNSGMLIFICLFLYFGEGLPQQLPPVAEIDQYVTRVMEDWHIPGLAIGVVTTDRLIFAKGYGVRTLGTQDPVDEHTLFAIASNTKAFTATLLLMLQEQGKLALDDRVVDHLPEFQLYDPYVTREMSIRDLLTHRSGLPTFGGDHLWIGNDLSREEIIARLRFLNPSAPFRSRYQYQNLMFMVAGHVAETVAGKSWDDLIRDWIFAPLGMTESNTSIRYLKGVSNVATPHETVDGKIVPVAYDSTDAVAPAGAINSNIVNMARWMQFHLNRGKVGEKQLVNPGSLREMHSIQFPLPVSERTEKLYGTRFSGYGLGWRITEYQRWKLIQHGGGLTGMISLQTLVPEKGYGILVLTNYAPNSAPGIITYWLLDHLLGREPADWNQIYLEQKRKADQRKLEREKELVAARSKNTKPSLPLQQYTGIYEDKLSGQAKVFLKDGKLVFYYNKRHVGELEHWHYDTFRVHWQHQIFDMQPKTFLSFHLNTKGEVSGLTVTFYDPIRFEKKKPLTEGSNGQ